MTTIRILFVVYVSLVLSYVDGNDTAYTGTSDSGQNVDIQKQHKGIFPITVDVTHDSRNAFEIALE